MTIFKYFIKIMMRYYLATIVYTVIFLGIGYLTLPHVKEEKEYMEVKADFVIFDEDESEASQHFIEYLSAKNNRVLGREKENMEEEVYVGMYDVGFLIPKGFQENPEFARIEVFNNALSPYSSKIILEARGYIYLLLAGKQADGSYDFEKIDEALQQESKLERIQLEQRQQSKDEWLKRFANSSLYPISAIIIFVIGMVMADLNDSKILFRNRCSGKPVFQFQRGIILGQLCFGVFICGITILGGMAILRFDLSNINWAMYALSIFMFMFAVLCFSFLLNHAVRNKNAISGIANIFSLGSAFISGAFIPMEFLSPMVINFAKFFPGYYFVMANESIYLGTQDWMKYMGILVLFGVGYFLLGTYIMRIKQTQESLA